MKVIILGDGIVSLALAKTLVNEGIQVDLVNNSNVIKSSLEVSKLIITPLTKILDYGVVAIVSVVVYKYLFEPRL